MTTVHVHGVLAVIVSTEPGCSVLLRCKYFRRCPLGIAPSGMSSKSLFSSVVISISPHLGPANHGWVWIACASSLKRSVWFSWNGYSSSSALSHSLRFSRKATTSCRYSLYLSVNLNDFYQLAFSFASSHPLTSKLLVVRVSQSSFCSYWEMCWLYHSSHSLSPHSIVTRTLWTPGRRPN